MKRAVQRELETCLAKALLRGEFVDEDTIIAEAGETGGLILRKGAPSGAGRDNGQPAALPVGRF